MARPAVSDLHALVRKLADDIDQGAGVILQDADLYEIDSHIQRKIFRELVKRGHESPQAEITRTITTADNELNWAVPVGQELPADFVTPLFLWEKLQGTTDSTYEPMSNAKERLPDVDSSDRLIYWCWQGESAGTDGPSIRFIAPTTNRTVRILYIRESPAITATNQSLYIPGALDAMAYGVLSKVTIRRGESRVTQYFDGLFREEMNDLMKVYGKTEARRPRRRLPYPFAKWLRKV